MMAAKKNKPIIFVQSIDVYDRDILVAAGATQEQVIRFCKHTKANAEFIKFVTEFKEPFEMLRSDKNKGACFCADKAGGGMMMLLREMDRNEEFWMSLTHEIHHAVFHMTKEQMMVDEPEAQAYLYCYLFKSIQNKLLEYEKPKK